jgi:thiamine kinase-like enzyme
VEASVDDRLLDSIPELRSADRTVEPLPGGLTNRNFKVSTPAGNYVVRLSSAESELLAINRDHEHRNSVIAAASVGAPVIGYRPEARMMVVGYIDGHTFTDGSFSVPGNLRRVAEACRRLHHGARFVNDFNMFELQRGYLELVCERGFRLPTGYRSFEPQVEQIRTALRVQDPGTVACNNDLLAGNFVDDGQQLWLIDYEYSGNNDACFDLGNIWSECHLSLDQLEELVTSYYRRPLRNRFARAQLQGLMSRYGWTLWASIQQATSTLDFDFWSWGMEKYDAAVEMFRGPDFARLLAEAQRPD